MKHTRTLHKAGGKCGNHATGLAAPALKITDIGGASGGAPFCRESRASPWDARGLLEKVTSALPAAIRVGRGF